MSYGPPYGPGSSAPDEVEFPGPDRPRSPRRLLSLLGVALVAMAGGAGIAYAAGHSGGTPAADAASSVQSTPPSPSPSASPVPRFGGKFPRSFGKLGPGFGGFGFAFGGLGFGGAIHGQLTEPKPGGGYQTVDVQSGSVTKVSSSSITVKSADGYTATYAVSSSTEVNAQAAGIATIKVGDTVSMTATVSNGTATADDIIDLSSIKSSRGWFGFKTAPPPSSQN
jgi:hypothetical protein